MLTLGGSETGYTTGDAGAAGRFSSRRRAEGFSMAMPNLSQCTKVADTANTEVYVEESDPDILIVVPREGTMDNLKDASENVAFYHEYARSLGRPCGAVVVMSNMLSQDAEARRAYTTLDPDLLYGGALIVENALSRALGSFYVGLTRPKVPTKLFDTVENGVRWLKAMRPDRD
jgi:hypothetical protein